MDDVRRKKIEAGKLKLAEFKKRKYKSNKTRNVEIPATSIPTANTIQIQDENSESLESSSIESLNIKCESNTPTVENMDLNLETENSFQLLEGDCSDDISQLENAQLLSLFKQKINIYQAALDKREGIIQKLTERLGSAMMAKEASDSMKCEEVVNLKQEIDLLHLQVKEAAEMVERQNSKIEFREAVQEACGDGKYINLRAETKTICEASIQVETSELTSCLSHLSGNPETLDTVLSKYFKMPEFSQQLSNFLKDNAAENELKALVDNLNCLISVECVKANKDLVNSMQEQEEQLHKYPNEKMPSLLKKIETLSVVAKLIESLVNASTRTLNESTVDFSCSKFQSFFLRRLNSTEEEPDASENETSDINYAEVVEPESFVKNQDEFPSIEKLRSRVVAEDFSLVTDFLLDEMDKISSSVPCSRAGPQGDSAMIDSLEGDLSCKMPNVTSISPKLDAIDSDYQRFLLQKSKLECRINNLKKLDKELQVAEKNIRQRSIDSDTLTNSEDNILLEEPPLSCVSLLSLTDSEYRTEFPMTDSETNYSRKVSFDITRPTQDRDVCLKCDRYFDLMKEKYDDHVCIFKEALENNLNIEKTETVKLLESEIEKLRLEKKVVSNETSKQIELLCQEQEMKLQHLSHEYEKELSPLQASNNKWNIERENLLLKLRDMEAELSQSNKKINDVLEEKASLVQQHQQDLASNLEISKSKWDIEKENLLLKLKDLEDKLAQSNKTIQDISEDKACLVKQHQQELVNKSMQLTQEKKKIETEYISTFEVLKKLHEDEIEDLQCSFKKQLEAREASLINEHSKALSFMETTHSNESATYQKKIEQLLEEKCELLAKTTQEYEAILKKNHKVLVMLCNHLRLKLNVQKEKIFNESHKSINADFEMSFSDALDDLNRSIEHGILKFLNQNYFLSDDNEEYFDDTEYLQLEIRQPVSDTDLPVKNDADRYHDDQLKYVPEAGKELRWTKSLTQLSDRALSEGSLESDDNYNMILSVMNKQQEQTQKDAGVYQAFIAKHQKECLALKEQAKELEDHKKKLETQLHEKEKELTAKESQLVALDAGSKGSMSGSQLSSTEIRSWQVDAAQTNSRLLHVLSDLVKTFMDIEHDINVHLVEHGLIPSRSGTLTHHDEETGHSVGSREDFASLSIGECPTIELVEDGPDLTPRTWDLFASAGTYDTEMEGEDVVLGASRRLRLAVDHLLNLLTRALDNQQNQDLKLLLKRNEELSQELQEESQGRDAVHMELVTAESTIRKLEAEKQRLEDLNQDLQDNQEMMKREFCTEKNKVAQLAHEKETACDEIQMLKGQCELLASRLGDPERKLLQENSRLSTEKQTVQKNLSKERQSFLDRLQQMEMALEELNAEKEEVVELKCKEIRDLKAEMEAMENQLQSNKKFIDEQAQEREQETEEYMKEINKMKELVREKEKIQSNEVLMTKEIESLEQLLRARIEDHQNAMKKKENVENDLRQSLDKIRDLRDVIDEYEKQLDMKCKIESELRQKLAGLNESFNAQEKINSAVDDGISKTKNVQLNGESVEQVENLKEQLASRSREVEQMSQNQTLLHELRGQIHFLEAKVEQRARLLESMHLASYTSPVQSDDNSPSGSQGSEPLQLPYEDGYEMSPRSIHWLEVRRLEEKIGRLAHIDEELIRKNKELESQLKKMKINQTECQYENAALQEKLSEQLLQVSILKSHMDEQKHRCTTPQKIQATNEKIEELHEAFEKQLENNKRLLSELQETQGALNVIEEESEKKDSIIIILQRNVEELKKKIHLDTEPMEKVSTAVGLDPNESPACFKLMLLEKNEEIISKTHEMECLRRDLEHLQKCSENSTLLVQELETKTKIAEEFETENTRLKSEVEHLKSEIESLKESLANAKEQVEMEQAQVETLCEEMANLSQNSIEDAVSHKSDNNEASMKALMEEKLILTNKLNARDNQLRVKNVEISVLNASITKLEVSLRASRKDLELEQVQVDTLLQELGSLTGYQKRLEQDFNIVQEMMQQKERELATLHEETDAQMRLEAELESLERELGAQKEMEEGLRQRIQQIESSNNTIKLENEKWRMKIDDLEKCHSLEVGNLREQIRLCKNISSEDVEDIELSEIQKEIIEAANAFGVHDAKAYGELVYALLKKAVDIKLNKMLKEHKSQLNETNESWEEKIKTELGKKSKFKSYCEKLEKENLLLREKFDERNQRVSFEKNSEWQAKLNGIEKTLRHELQVKYEAELNGLKHNLDTTSKEKSSAEAKVSKLSRQLKDLKKKSESQRNELLKEFETKVLTFENELKERVENRQQTEMFLKQEIERLEEELASKLKKEQNLEERHREEISNLHKVFETRWANEMKKIQTLQIEELKKLKDSKEKNVEALCNHLFAQYGEKLKKLQEEYALQLEEERKLTVLQHKSELQELQQSLEKRFEKEKQLILETKDKEIKLSSESLERRYNKKIAELRQTISSAERNNSSDKNGRSRWEKERLELFAIHEKEIVDLKQELGNQYQKMLETHLIAHQAEMRNLEETYSQKVEEVQELIRDAKRAASRTCHSDSGSNRTTTPSSEMTSSDEACSSCQEDMLPANRHMLVSKIHQDGKRVLSLIESSHAQSSTEREARLWLEERKWIVNKVKTLTPEVTRNQVNLKIVINNLVEELQNARQKLINSNGEITSTKEKCSQLEDQLNTERSKLYVIATNLGHQTQVITELESILNIKTNEVTELKKIVANQNRLSYYNSAEKDSFQLHNENLSSSSHDVGCLRSGDEPRSAERFSMFLPEIGSMSLQKTAEEIEVSQNITPLPQFTTEIDYPDQPNSPDSVFQESRNDISSVREKLSAMVNNTHLDASYETKLHGLYWVYKRSLSYNKSLVYQKKYLLMLLRGFQMTEKVTMAWLNHMGDDHSSRSQGNDSSSSEPPLRGRSLFRSAAFVVIALQRMRFYVRRWRLLARIPSTQVVDAEIRGVFQSYSVLSPTLTPGGCNLSTISLSSKSTSIGGGELLSNSQTLTNSRSDNKANGKYATADKRQLIEYVHRLETLQKQLGLDNFR